MWKYQKCKNLDSLTGPCQNAGAVWVLKFNSARPLLRESGWLLVACGLEGFQGVWQAGGKASLVRVFKVFLLRDSFYHQVADLKVPNAVESKVEQFNMSFIILKDLLNAVLSLSDDWSQQWKIPVDQVVDVKVLVVLAKGIDQGLGNVEPAKVEDEL